MLNAWTLNIQTNEKRNMLAENCLNSKVMNVGQGVRTIRSGQTVHIIEKMDFLEPAVSIICSMASPGLISDIWKLTINFWVHPHILFGGLSGSDATSRTNMLKTNPESAEKNFRHTEGGGGYDTKFF